jgi:hypothetical protein
VGEEALAVRRLIVAAVIVGLAGGALVGPAEAKKPKKKKRVERVAEGTYDNPALGVPGVAGTSSAGGAFEFGLASNESFIDVEITDESGQAVMATMSQDTDPSTPSWEIFATFCGKTDEPVPVEPGIAVRVSVYTVPGPDDPSCVGPASSGVIKATFSNIP